MKIKFRAAVTGLSAIALAGAALVVAAGPASAAVPPYEPTAYNLGQIQFYNVAGHRVTGGSVDGDPFAAYAVATSTDPHTSNTAATLYAYTPVSGQDPLLWSGEQLTAAETFPVTDPGAPAVVRNAGAHRPVVTVGTTANGVINLAGYIADFPNTNAAGSGYDKLYQLRIRTAGNDPKFWAADISVTGSTWTLVYPTDNSSITISKSTTIRYGSATTTSTVLKDTTTHSVIKSAPVKLYKRANPHKRWSFVANAKTNTAGKASKSVKPTAHTLYQWRYAGGSTHAAATSPTQTVSVAQVVSAHSTKSRVARHVAFKIWGTVKPASSRQAVQLQRLFGRTWRKIASAKIKRQKLPNGSRTVGFVFTVKQRTKGTYKYRVYKPATSTLVKGYSRTLTVKVT